MASKCWFVLQQTHYPPPVIPKNGTGTTSGPICLGHLIPDLKHLDNVINRHGPLKIPPDMPIYSTKAWDLTYELRKSEGAGVSGNAGVPIAAAAGLTVKMDEFESLDTFIFQPTSEYVEDSIEDEEVSAYLQKRGLFGSTSLFMTTGMIIARGAKSKASEVRKRDVHWGPGVGFPAVAEVGMDVSVSSETGISSTGQKATDFVWALRLAKISKGFIDKDWYHETFSKGATFGLDDGAEQGKQIVEALEAEGIKGLENVNIKPDDDVFVLRS